MRWCYLHCMYSVSLLFLFTEGFQPSNDIHRRLFTNDAQASFDRSLPQQRVTISTRSQQSKIFAVNNNDNEDMKRKRDILIHALSRIKAQIKNVSTLPMVVPVTIAMLTSSIILGKPNTAQASAPVMALPKAEGRDPASEAIMEHERRSAGKTQQELNEMTVEARKIEAEQGEAARIKFENEYKDRQQKIADERDAGLIDLKRSLLDQGICPFTDLEGQRQSILYSRGVDLGKVPGTQFYLEKEFERTSPKRSMAYKKSIHRRVIACMVQDMKNRDIDPLNYFERHQDQTEAILDLPVERAAALVKQYEANLEEYGQILPPAEGEMSVKEKMAIKDPVAEAAEAKRLKAEEKAMAKKQKEAEKAELARKKAEEKEKKELLKAKAKDAAIAAKEAAKKAKDEAKSAAEEAKRVAAAAAASAVAASLAAASGVEAAAESIGLQDSVSSIVEQIDSTTDGAIAEIDDAIAEKQSPEMTTEETPSTVSSDKAQMPDAVKGGAAVVLIGGSGIAFKLYRDKVEKDEEERKRQLRLLMGGGKDSDAPASAPALEEVEVDMKNKPSAGMTKAAADPVSSIETQAPKKRRLGMKNVFGKKKNERETDLMALVSVDAEAPEFTKTLAKMLTFGAVGRFPAVVSLMGGKSMEKFDLEEAKKILIESQDEADLSLEESAEIFANVVNCMLIDIVDLASASLKEKDEKVTVDAINVVVDFMNHAASLYDSIAEGVTITPVTYGGDLSKSKLEQMYSAYAVSGMMNMDKMSDDFDNRVAMLQDVFQINEKKAEGLMMKAMQKNMMGMLKNGEGMEGMEEMLKGMGGLDGMPPGLGGMDGDGPSPEQLKEMLTALKDMKDSGSIPPDEFDKVKKQFNEAFGSSIDDVVKEASASNEELSSTDKELLELMKSIMKD